MLRLSLTYLTDLIYVSFGKILIIKSNGDCYETIKSF